MVVLASSSTQPASPGQDVSFTLVSQLTVNDPRRDEILNLIAYPDSGSVFEQLTAPMRLRLPREHWFGHLIAESYNGALFSIAKGRSREHCGEIFWQHDGRAMKIFSVRVVQAHRGKGLSYRMLTNLLHRVRGRQWVRDVGEIQLGNGGSEAMKRLLRRLNGESVICNELSIRVSLDRHTIILLDS